MKISVCIATYNGEKYIREQLDSILIQLGEGDEVIISDDSSTDKTIELIEFYKDSRIRILRNQKFHSPIYNFENAIKEATGECIFLSDQDDVWQFDKIEKMLPLLDQYDLVMSNAKVVDASLNIVKPKFHTEAPFKSLWYSLVKNPYTGCLIAFNRSSLKYILPFPKKLPMHDIWIGMCSEVFANVYFLDEILILYRRHGNNVSSTSEKSTLPYLYRLQYRMYLLFQIVKRVIVHKKLFK